MKTMKRFSAILLAVLMLVVMMAVPASAAEGTATHSITIEGAAGHTFEAYQIFTGDLSGLVLSNIVWGDGVNDATLLPALKTMTKLSSCNSLEEIVGVMENTNIWNEADTIAFAEIVAAHTTTKKGDGADSGSNYVISSLEPGYYIVKDTTDLDGVNDANSRYIISVTKDAAINIKKAVPSLEKTVSRSADTGYGEAVNAGISNTVYFKLTAKMHDRVGDYAAYKLVFEDTLPAGLAFKQLEAVYVNGNIPVDNSQVDVNHTGSPVTFTVADAKTVISDATNGASVVATDTLSIVFSATVNSAVGYGQDGVNTNNAILKYSNDPYDTDSLGKTTSDTALVYSYQMTLTKVDSANQNTTLSGAQFIVSFVDDTGKTQYVIASGGDGVYTVQNITLNRTAVAEDPGATVMTTNGSGQITLKGLRDRVYTLTEVKAPDSYNLIPEASTQTVTISPTIENGTLTSLAATKVGDHIATVSATALNGMVNVTVTNDQGATLPTTGGIGTTIFYGIGGLLVIGALSLLLVRKRSAAK